MKTVAQSDRSISHAALQIASEIASKNEILKHGLAIQEKFNTMCAFENLIFRGISTDIITAVLFAAVGANKNRCH